MNARRIPRVCSQTFSWPWLQLILTWWFCLCAGGFVCTYRLAHAPHEPPHPACTCHVRTHRTSAVSNTATRRDTAMSTQVDPVHLPFQTDNSTSAEVTAAMCFAHGNLPDRELHSTWGDSYNVLNTWKPSRLATPLNLRWQLQCA